MVWVTEVNQNETAMIVYFVEVGDGSGGGARLWHHSYGSCGMSIIQFCKQAVSECMGRSLKLLSVHQFSPYLYMYLWKILAGSIMDLFLTLISRFTQCAWLIARLSIWIIYKMTQKARAAVPAETLIDHLLMYVTLSHDGQYNGHFPEKLSS